MHVQTLNNLFQEREPFLRDELKGVSYFKREKQARIT
jgi:hypothetical protein